MHCATKVTGGGNDAQVVAVLPALLVTIMFGVLQDGQCKVTLVVASRAALKSNKEQNPNKRTQWRRIIVIHVERPVRPYFYCLHLSKSVVLDTSEALHG